MGRRLASIPLAWMANQPVHALVQPVQPSLSPSQRTCGQLLEDGSLEGGGLQLANLGGRNVLPSDGELGGQVGAGRRCGCYQLGASTVGLGRQGQARGECSSG